MSFRIHPEVTMPRQRGRETMVLLARDGRRGLVIRGDGSVDVADVAGAKAVEYLTVPLTPEQRQTLNDLSNRVYSEFTHRAKRCDTCGARDLDESLGLS